MYLLLGFINCFRLWFCNQSDNFFHQMLSGSLSFSWCNFSTPGLNAKRISLQATPPWVSFWTRPAAPSSTPAVGRPTFLIPVMWVSHSGKQESLSLFQILLWWSDGLCCFYSFWFFVVVLFETIYFVVFVFIFNQN